MSERVITTQRALELAKKCERYASLTPTYEPERFLSPENRNNEFSELAAILRHYAEIMQTEVGAVAPAWPHRGGQPDLYFAAASPAEMAGLIEDSYDGGDYKVVELIIKPKPLELK